MKSNPAEPFSLGALVAASHAIFAGRRGDGQNYRLNLLDCAEACALAHEAAAKSLRLIVSERTPKSRGGWRTAQRTRRAIAAMEQAQRAGAALAVAHEARIDKNENQPKDQQG